MGGSTAVQLTLFKHKVLENDFEGACVCVCISHRQVLLSAPADWQSSSYKWREKK